MSELAMTLLRLSYLVLLWVFVWAAITVLRQDLYTVTKVTPRGAGRKNESARRRRQVEPDAPAPVVVGPSGAPNVPPRPPARASGRQPSRLRVTSGKLAGTAVPLGKSAIVVGRAQSATLVLEDDYASTRHARFFPNGDAWFVEDLGSTNGTFVDGQRITGPVQLAIGQPVQIGQSTMELTR